MADFDSRALAELAEAALRYDAEVPGLGTLFLDEVERLVALIGEQPELGSVRRRTRAREIPTHTFPYLVVYTTQPLRIVAVAHAKRRPGYWRARLPRG